MQDQEQRSTYFPHLKQVILATHSQHFLHTTDIQSNYVVEKADTCISLTRVVSMSDFHRLQFNLLGNSLEGLFLPSAVLFVEGDTDQKYLGRLLSLRFPGRNVVTVATSGDPKRKIAALRESLGDLQKSPLGVRLFVVLDQIHERSLRAELMKLGVPADNVVVWTKNGIEYLYPPSALSRVFQCAPEALSKLDVTEDSVSLNGITKRKGELCAEIVAALEDSTQLPPELEHELLDRVSRAID